MYDTKQLENLSYRAAGYKTSDELCECAECKNNYGIGQPAKSPPATLGMNSHVIKPESRVNSSEVAEQVLEQVKQTHCPNCGQEWKIHGPHYTCIDNKAEQPNKDSMTDKEQTQIGIKMSLDGIRDQAKKEQYWNCIAGTRQLLDLFCKEFDKILKSRE